MTSAVILGMIVTMFPEPREQATAIGIYSFVASAGASIGLLAGGVITQGINWHWIFFVNLPIGIAAAVLALRLLEPDRGLGLREGADVAGAVLVTAALMLGVYTIVGAVDHGWGSAHTLGFGAVAIALLAGFVARQATAGRPPRGPARAVDHARRRLDEGAIDLARANAREAGLDGRVRFPAAALTSTMQIGLLSPRCRHRAASACWMPPSTCCSVGATTRPG